MKKLTSILLSLALSAAFILSTAAQSLQTIPVHFHVQPGVPATQQQLDTEIALLNKIYSSQGTRFRFQGASVDNIHWLISEKTELNVFVEELPCEESDCLFGYAYSDSVHLNYIGLPDGKYFSGIVLIHETAHWLGLDEISLPKQDGLGNCLDVPNLTPGDQNCYFTPDQIKSMGR